MGLTKIGALWVKDGKKGKFMSGQVEIEGVKYAILVFKNTKTSDKQPDYNINLRTDEPYTEDREERTQPGFTEQQSDENEDLPF